MGRLAPRAAVVALAMCAMMLLPAMPGTDASRAPEDLSLFGTVRTGDGSSFVRTASVTLQVYDGARTVENLTHNGLVVSDDEGVYTFTVPAAEWNAGWNATLTASYPLVGASGSVEFTLLSGTAQLRDVALEWNRTLGAAISVDRARIATPRDSKATFIVNVTNGGNDTDSILLWALPDEAGVTAGLTPKSRVELAPGRSQLLNLVVEGPGKGAGDHGVLLGWNSDWFSSEAGSLDLVWEVVPEVMLSVSSVGVSWTPDPLYKGDQAQLNCTVANGGRDAALGANVTVVLVHPTQGEVLRDRVRLDVPARGCQTASFPWTAVEASAPYQLRFEVEHPLDVGHEDDTVQVDLPVGVRNTPPTVAFASPINGSRVSSNVTVRLSITDPDATSGATAAFLRIDGGAWTEVPVASPTYRWDTTLFAEGWHTLEAYAIDAYSQSKTVAIEVKVENLGPNTPPVVEVAAPAEGDMFADVLWARGDAYDPDPEGDVVAVEARMDSGAWTVADGTRHWTVELDTSVIPEGPHVLWVRAFDGIDRSEPVRVNVNVTHASASALVVTLEAYPVSVLPGEVIELRGEVLYDNGVRAREVQVRLSGPGLATDARATTDARGRYVASATAPSTEGTYTYAAECTADGGLTGSAQAELRVIRPIVPDLAVVSILIGDGLRAVGVNLTVAVEVRNLGGGQADCNVTVWEGEPGTGTPVAHRLITVYDSLNVSFVWAPSRAGRIALWVEVAEVAPPDANLSNNRLSENVTVVEVPDVSIIKVVPSNRRPYENIPISVSVGLENRGGVNATCDVELYLDDLNGTSRVSVRTNVLVVAGGTAFASFDWTPVGGHHVLFARVVNVHPDEASAEDNEASTSVDVQGPYEPPEEDEEAFLAAPGPWAAAVALAVAACVCAALARRRRP